MAPKAPPKPAADEEDEDLEIWNCKFTTSQIK
jgi:hypothetical protein